MRNFLTALFALVTSLGSAQSPVPSPTAKRAIQARLGDEAAYWTNSSQTFLLAIKVNRQDKWQKEGLKKILIYDLKADKITFEDEIQSGDAQWESDTQVRLTLYPAVRFDDSVHENTVYLIDAKSGRKRKR